MCALQVLHTLEGVGVVVFPELWPALFTAGGAVAGRLGFHPLPRESGTFHMKVSTLVLRARAFVCLKYGPLMMYELCKKL